MPRAAAAPERRRPARRARRRVAVRPRAAGHEGAPRPGRRDELGLGAPRAARLARGGNGHRDSCGRLRAVPRRRHDPRRAARRREPARGLALPLAREVGWRADHARQAARASVADEGAGTMRACAKPPSQDRQEQQPERSSRRRPAELPGARRRSRSRRSAATRRHDCV